MKNNELLKKYAGISTRIRRIFAYHYDQIQREVQTEISTLNPELQGQFIINDTTDYIEIYEIEIEDEPFDEFLDNIITYASEADLFENLRENLIRMDLTKGADDQYYDYSPSQVEAILFGILQLTPEHQDIIVIDLKKHLKSFIQDKDQAEEMITQYTCYYNAIKRWESNHKETEILHQLEISNLLEQLKNN